jgi:hypothetical protein
MARMKIKEYYHQLKTKAAFAEECGISWSYLCLISQGKRRPSPQLAAIMEKASHGLLDKFELLYPENRK